MAQAAVARFPEQSGGNSTGHRIDLRQHAGENAGAGPRPGEAASATMADTESVPDASAALVRELTRVQRLHAERTGNPILAGSLERVAYWQSRRLRMTYADLAADPRYGAAVAFFQNDLYGPGDFSRRDADLARVVPLMVKVLPDRVIATVALATELNALSQELDRVLLARLPRADGHFSVL